MEGRGKIRRGEGLAREAELGGGGAPARRRSEWEGGGVGQKGKRSDRVGRSGV